MRSVSRKLPVLPAILGLLVGFAFVMLLPVLPEASAAGAKKGRCNKAYCYKWDARRKRCRFACRVGHACYRGKCIRVKRCRWSRCQKFDLRRGRCVSRCNQRQRCLRGRCIPKCLKRSCYSPRKRRCVRACVRGKKCRRGVCR